LKLFAVGCHTLGLGFGENRKEHLIDGFGCAGMAAGSS
jgi:hypothetical protein